MTSFELFGLLEFKKNIYIFYIFAYFLLKYIMSGKLHVHHFIKKQQIFRIKLWYINWYQK